MTTPGEPIFHSIHILMKTILHLLERMLQINIAICHKPHLQPFSTFPIRRLVINLIVQFKAQTFIKANPALAHLISRHFYFQNNRSTAED